MVCVGFASKGLIGKDKYDDDPITNGSITVRLHMKRIEFKSRVISQNNYFIDKRIRQYPILRPKVTSTSYVESPFLDYNKRYKPANIHVSLYLRN